MAERREPCKQPAWPDLPCQGTACHRFPWAHYALVPGLISSCHLFSYLSREGLSMECCRVRDGCQVCDCDEYTGPCVCICVGVLCVHLHFCALLWVCLYVCLSIHYICALITLFKHIFTPLSMFPYIVPIYLKAVTRKRK